MDLDNIMDIEVLREELKKNMTKCVKSFSTTDDNFNTKIEFKKGMYYYLNGLSATSEDEKYTVSLSFDEKIEYFA